MAVPQLADVKEEHHCMEKSVHDVTFLLEQRRAYNIPIEEGGTREKVGQANVLKVECDWKISSVPAVDHSFDELLC